MRINGEQVTLNPKVETIVRAWTIGFSAFRWAGVGALDGGRVCAVSMPMGYANDQLTEVPVGTFDSVHQELRPLPWQFSAVTLAGGKPYEILETLLRMEYVNDSEPSGVSCSVVSASPDKAKSPAFTTLGALVAAVELWYELQGAKHGNCCNA